MNERVQISPTASAPFRFTVDQFLALCDQGLFDEFAKVELIEGEIVVMNAQFARHARIKSNLMRRIGNALEAMGSPLQAWTEVSILLSDGTLPEPDIVVTSYRGTGAVPLETVALVIEVSDSTLDTDLGRKADLYAQAGVPEYWVVDLNEDRVLMHANPRPGDGGYDGQLDVLFGTTLYSATVEGLEVESTGLE